MDTLEELLPTRIGEPQDRIDAAAVVGQFLRDLDLADLVVELVQNELDAGATRTVIDFGERALTCEGDGQPFDTKGWLRLESVLGAGGDVEAKKDGIGSKNHGLRSAFLLADRIGVQSGGLRADLTVRGDLRRPTRFKPAFWPRQVDQDAPAKGTRIVAPYRTVRLRRPDGDDTHLEPLTPGELDSLWESAVSGAPERFLTASRPGAPWSYTLVLKRAGRDPCELRFKCEPLSDARRGLWMRTCKVSQAGRSLTTVGRRHAMRFPITVSDGGKIPRLFRNGSHLYGEVSWPVNLKGRPQRSVGGLRYPIAFPTGEARSGHGFDISAPFIAGRARHSLSQDPRNAALILQGRRAVMNYGQKLAKAYGPDVGELVRSADPHDADRGGERELIEAWLDRGGLSLEVFGKGPLPKAVGSLPAPPGRAVVLVRSATRQKPSPSLTALAAGVGAVVCSDHPPVLLEVLGDLADEGDPRVKAFDEEDASRRVFLDHLAEGAAVDSKGLAWARAALSCLEDLKRAGGVPASLVADLQEKGSLPAHTGLAVAWKEARIHDGTPPDIPGVKSPPVIHGSLKEASVLRLGSLQLRRFNLNDFVSSRDFNNVIPAGRRNFFNWLRTNAHTLKASALKRIADYPVWPGADGVFRRLDDYCRPRAGPLRELFGHAVLAPDSAVSLLLADKRLPAGALQLRDRPSEAEIVSWHAKQVQAVVAEADADQRRRSLEALETRLEQLRARDFAAMRKLGEQHLSLSQAGDLTPISTLHLPNLATLACALAPSFLARPKFAKLYEALGAKPRPDAAALIEALRRDLDWTKLYIRLEAYAGLDLDLSTLAGEPIIPGEDGPRPGQSLCFAGDADYWGSWKSRLRPGDVAQHHSLLRQLGVVRSQPNRDTSLAFFRWLATQPRDIQRQHQAQIARHWRDRFNGPLAWAQNHPDARCLPVTGKGQAFALVALTEALSDVGDVFLDDFPEIRDDLLKDGKVRLTLNKVQGLQGTNLDLFRAAKVPSLRRAIGQPRALTMLGDLRMAPEEDGELARLRSGSALASLKTRLPLQDVALSDLRPEWQKSIKELKGVRLAKGLTARYRFRGRDYELPVAGGVDSGSRLICLAHDADRLNEFYAVLARYIFRPGLGDVGAWGLMRAARDRRQLSLFEAEDSAEQDGDEAPAEGEANGDVHAGHGLSNAKLAPVVPNPGTLADISDPTFLSGRKKVRKARPLSAHEDQRNSVEEEEQKRALKRDHYGFHCQACLGEMDVLKAAPPGTYVFAPGYRERLLHAHHAHQIQNKGMVGGKNLLILCEYHHRLWGDRLSRDSVLVGLTGATTIQRKFPTDVDGKSTLRREGLLATIAIDVAPFQARLFFTPEHADAWRKAG